MKRASKLTGYKLGASDGEIGRVKDFYFDDQHWGIRYLVADTGRWLTGRQVLIAPFAIDHIDDSGSAVAVDLTKRQIEDSPPIEEHLPVSREYEARHYQYYGWPFYWNGPFLWGHAPLPAAHPGGFAPDESTFRNERSARPHVEAENHLRSFREVCRYNIQASDGEIGHVEDFLLDVRHWAVRYLIIDTRNWWPGKHVLVAPQWVSGIAWHASRVAVDLDRESIKRAPEFDPGAHEISRDYEDELHRYYGKEPYWRHEPGIHA